MDPTVELVLLICSVIAAIGGAFVAIKNIFEITGKPVNFVRKKQEQTIKTQVEAYLEEHLPELLKQHDLETRDRYRADRQNYLCEIKEEVLLAIQGKLEDVEELHARHDDLNEILISLSEAIQGIQIGMKNVLREKINAIFNRNKKDQTLTYHENDELTAYYKDYKHMGGNSYIDSRMEMMKEWKKVDDDEKI